MNQKEAFMKEHRLGKEPNRQPYSCSRIVALISGVALLCLATGRAYADDYGCTVANVAGSYGVYAFGTNLSGNAGGFPAGPAATSGKAEFDGQGNFSFVASASFDGIISQGVTGQGTYAVNPDCTGTVVIPPVISSTGTVLVPGLTSSIVFVDNRNEIYGVHTTAGITANIIHTTAGITANIIYKQLPLNSSSSSGMLISFQEVC
jgi:hypothetical protein